MEITFQNKLEDLMETYQYFYTTIPIMKQMCLKAVILKQAFILALFFIMVSINPRNYLFPVVYIFLFFEFAYFAIARFKPVHFEADNFARNQLKRFGKQFKRSYTSPGRLEFDTKWLKLYNEEARYEWVWDRIERIGLTDNFIFVRTTNNIIISIPRRDFDTRREFMEFWEKLNEVRDSYFNQASQ